MERYIKAICAVIIFVCSQAVVAAVIAVLNVVHNLALSDGSIKAEKEATILSSSAFALILIVSGLLTVLLVHLFKMTNTKSLMNAKTIDWKWASVAIIAAFLGIFSTSLISEFMNLPDSLGQQFMELSNSVLGIVAIAIVGPVVEEIVFREAVCGGLIRKGVDIKYAVIFSALCFGIIHMNPAQIPFAFVVGLILAVIYVKTGNIVVTSIIHIINNSLAVVQMNVLGENASEYSLLDKLGYVSIPLIAVLAIGCVYLLKEFWLRYQEKANV